MFDSQHIIAIGSDHAGFKIKEHLKLNLQQSGFVFQDFGATSEIPADYPDIAHKLAKAVQNNSYKLGILICGSGNGMAIVANKYIGVRAALCWNEEITNLARKHNNANILVLPGRFISPEDAVIITKIFLSADFEGGRHIPRVDKISNIL